MLFIGNDVVDLGDPETEAVHPRFDDRVFSSAERAAIASSSDTHRTRWLLWACKESVYKAWKRDHPGAHFLPIAYQVSAFECRTVAAEQAHGSVRIADVVIPVFVSYGAQYVHATVGDCSRSPCGKRLVADVVRIGQGEDASVRVRRLASALLLRASKARAVYIRSEDGIPTAYVDGSGKGQRVSLSHHGRFAAAVVMLE